MNPESLIATIDDLAAAPYNPRRISDDGRAALAASIERFGDIAGITWNAKTRRLVAGHQRVEALRSKYGSALRIEREEHGGVALIAPNGDRFAVRVVDWDEGTEKAANVAANSPMLAGEFTEDLDALLAEIRDFDGALFDDLRMDELLAAVTSDRRGTVTKDEARATLAERFLVPPFSVLDARQGYWLERKRAWLALGIESEEGRADNLIWATSAQPPQLYALRNEMREASGRDPEWDAVLAEASRRGMSTTKQTSVFDAVLCELAYRWFCRPHGRVLDPFAGGSVRGIVASMLGLAYLGVDLRAEQVAANEAQAAKVCDGNATAPQWIVGDSVAVLGEDGELAGKEATFDFVFSCPPYGDLERYSDDPKDLSAMDWESFLTAYRAIIGRCVAMLSQDAFAIFVVGDIRGKNGNYRGFVQETIRAFTDSGAALYNDAVLVTPASSGAIRASKAMQGTRKLTKTHQNVLVFLKGDAKRAVAKLGTIEVADLSELADGEE